MAQRRLLYYASFRPRKSERSGQFRGPCCYSLAMRLKTKVASCIRHPMRAVFHMKSYRPKPCNFSRSASLDWLCFQKKAREKYKAELIVVDRRDNLARWFPSTSTRGGTTFSGQL